MLSGEKLMLFVGAFFSIAIVSALVFTTKESTMTIQRDDIPTEKILVRGIGSPRSYDAFENTYENFLVRSYDSVEVYGAGPEYVLLGFSKGKRWYFSQNVGSIFHTVIYIQTFKDAIRIVATRSMLNIATLSMISGLVFGLAFITVTSAVSKKK